MEQTNAIINKLVNSEPLELNELKIVTCRLWAIVALRNNNNLGTLSLSLSLVWHGGRVKHHRQKGTHAQTRTHLHEQRTLLAQKGGALHCGTQREAS